MGKNVEQKPVAVVTGASSGVGKDIASILALKGGCLTILVSRSKEKLSNAAAEISGQGGECLSYAADIRSEEEMAAMAEEIKKRYGRVNFLINNAGQGIFKAIGDLIVDEWNLMHETMVLGSFLCTKHLLPLMVNAAGYRHILINSSFWGVEGRVAKCTAYNSAKFAQRGFAQSLREELRQQGVKVTCFLPASIDTPFFDGEDTWEHTPERILSSKDLAQVVYDILYYPGNLVVEEMAVQAIDPD